MGNGNEANGEKLHRALDFVAESLVDASPQWAKATTQFQIKGLHALIAQEPALALMLICNNISESSRSISRETYFLLETVGQDLLASPFACSVGLSHETWEELKNQIS